MLYPAWYYSFHVWFKTKSPSWLVCLGSKHVLWMRVPCFFLHLLLSLMSILAHVWFVSLGPCWTVFLPKRSEIKQTLVTDERSHNDLLLVITSAGFCDVTTKWRSSSGWLIAFRHVLHLLFWLGLMKFAHYHCWQNWSSGYFSHFAPAVLLFS